LNRLLLLASAATSTPPPTLTTDTEVIVYDPSTWGFPQWTAAVGIIVTLGTLYVQFRKTRGDELTGRTNIKVSLDKMIDERVERQLTSAWTEIDNLKKDVGELKGSLEREREEKARIKTIVKRFLSALLHWDQGGRSGEMPMPSEEDLALLDFEPWSDTAQKRLIDTVREELRDEEPERY
jgi:hypothetical protein